MTTKQRRFIELYNGNGTEAARKAGYQGDNTVLANTAAENLRKPYIMAAIETREKKALNKGIAGREKLQRFWTDTLADPESSMKDRLKASELLGRSHAMFTDKVRHEGDLHITVIDRYDGSAK